MANFKQNQQMIPFITCEIPLCQDVCNLVLGGDVFDLDLGIQINSIEQPIKSNSVGPGNMSHRWTSAFHDVWVAHLPTPALHTLDDVLRFRGDEEYRTVLDLFVSTIWSILGAR